MSTAAVRVKHDDGMGVETMDGLSEEGAVEMAMRRIRMALPDEETSVLILDEFAVIGHAELLEMARLHGSPLARAFDRLAGFKQTQLLP